MKTSKLEWKDHMMCGRKKRFANGKLAQAHIRLNDLAWARVYGCPVCGGCHITGKRKKSKP